MEHVSHSLGLACAMVALHPWGKDTALAVGCNAFAWGHWVTSGEDGLASLSLSPSPTVLDCWQMERLEREMEVAAEAAEANEALGPITAERLVEEAGLGRDEAVMAELFERIQVRPSTLTLEVVSE